MTIPQNKIFDLVSLEFCYTFNSKFCQQTDSVAMGEPTSSTTAETYMHAHEETAIFTV